MSKRSRPATMSFDPYYVGSQASQVGYPVVIRSGRRRKSQTKATQKDKKLATIAQVKRLLDSRIEDKAQHFDDVINFGTYFLDQNLSVRALGPSSTTYLVSQGAGQGQRIGNVIRVKKVILKYYLFPLPYDVETLTTPMPQLVRIWIGNVRSDLSVKPDYTYMAKLYQSGNLAVPPTSTVDDMLAPINKDLFVEKASRVHKVGHAILDPANPNVQLNQYFSNNDFMVGPMGTIDITKFFRTKLHFDDTTNTPDSNVFMWMEAVNCDNTQSLEGPSVKMVYNVEFVYEDA